MRMRLSILSLAGFLLVLSCTSKPDMQKATSMKQGIPEMPILMPYENTLEHVWSQKEVLASLLLSEAEMVSPWVHEGEYGTLTLSEEKAYRGKSSILITSPTSGPSNPPGGRPWGVSSAFYKTDHADWTNWNRISFWIYPDLPGFKVVSISMVFHNEGEDKVPDIYNRNGLNYQVLENGKWNKVYWEIAHLGREKVTGIEIRYRLQGHEPGATGTARYFIDEVYLEKVEADHFEGWNVQQHEIAYNHAGYAIGYPKTAIVSNTSATTFTLVDAVSNKQILEDNITSLTTPTGVFRVIDFSAVDKAGTYLLKIGQYETKPFAIDQFATIYRSSILKTINHFYTQRCGYAIPHIHDACHLDWLCYHGEQAVGIHGGWHDAGDLSQGLGNTAEAAYSMIMLAGKLEMLDPSLAMRLLEEARWGVDWIVKTRFGNGYRNTWATKDMWTDGIINSADDFQSQASNSPHANYLSSTTEATAAIAFKVHDKSYSEYALKCAIEDFDFAAAKDQPLMEVDLAGAALNAALTLYEATADEKYKRAAVKYADYIITCQQQTELDTDISLKGFFYRNAQKETILHYAHKSSEQDVVVGLVKLSELIPEKAAEWEKALQLYAGYYKEITAINAPYYMIPAGIYDLTKAGNESDIRQISNGMWLNNRYYLKRFPTWTEFRGNSGTILSQAKGLAVVGKHLKDKKLLDIAYRQLDWHLGTNPFAQSLMYGEGYRYAGQYSVTSGNLVGGLPVGVQTHFDRDEPYWPAENCYNWKEIWVFPSSRWLMLMNDFL